MENNEKEAFTIESISYYRLFLVSKERKIINIILH